MLTYMLNYNNKTANVDSQQQHVNTTVYTRW